MGKLDFETVDKAIDQAHLSNWIGPFLDLFWALRKQGVDLSQVTCDDLRARLREIEEVEARWHEDRARAEQGEAPDLGVCAEIDRCEDMFYSSKERDDDDEES